MSYLFAGYMVIWTLLFFYLWHLNRRQKEIQSRLELLEERVQD